VLTVGPQFPRVAGMSCALLAGGAAGAQVRALSLRNCTGGSYAALSVTRASNVLLERVHFEENCNALTPPGAVVAGGALAVMQAGMVLLRGCVFVRSSATQGGGVYMCPGGVGASPALWVQARSSDGNASLQLSNTQQALLQQQLSSLEYALHGVPGSGTTLLWEVFEGPSLQAKLTSVGVLTGARARLPAWSTPPAHGRGCGRVRSLQDRPVLLPASAGLHGLPAPVGWARAAVHAADQLRECNARCRER
jgi:hypothetical protein